MRRLGVAEWTKRTAATLVPLVGLLVVSMIACRHPAEQHAPAEALAYVDLLSELSYTQAGQARIQVDFGSVRAAPVLERGWSTPERLPNGKRIVWAVANQAALRLDLQRLALASSGFVVAPFRGVRDVGRC